MEPEEPDYLSHVLLSGHSDSFSKYDQKLFLCRLPTAALTCLTHPKDHVAIVTSAK